MQTILGSGGAIGTGLAKELKAYTEKIRLVSRNPQKINDTDEIVAADLKDFSKIDDLVAGSEIVYVLVSFEYNAKIWEETWPPFMKSVVEACKNHSSKLVFFDNMYIYDPAELPHMTEESRINPSSRKGKVRKQLFEMIMGEVDKGNLKAMILRGADFYGPGIKTSVLQEMVLENLKKGKSAYWFMNADKKHSFTYSPDAAKATAILGNKDECYNQVWHMPAHPDTLTGRQWVELFAKELGVKPRIKVISGFMNGILGLFNPIMREFREMAYQWDRDYYFDGSKFEKKFDFKPTTYQQGVKQVVEAIRA